MKLFFTLLRFLLIAGCLFPLALLGLGLVRLCARLSDHLNALLP